MKSSRYVLADFITKSHRMFVLIIVFQLNKDHHFFMNHFKDTVVWALNLNIKLTCGCINYAKVKCTHIYFFKRNTHLKNSVKNIWLDNEA